MILTLLTALLLPPSAFAEVKAAAAQPTLVVVTGDRCPWCKMLEKDTLSQCKKELQDFRVIYSTDYQKWQCDSIPTLILLDIKGEEVDRHEGYMSKDAFLNFLQTAQEGD